MGANRGKGHAYAWLIEHKDHSGDGCLLWPFARERRSGRGTFSHEGKVYSARAFMCELVHGLRPSKDHQCAMTCEGGHAGCIHPQHMEWKTYSDVQHIRYRKSSKVRRPKRVLTPEQIDAIRLDPTLSQSKHAARYRVSLGAVQWWQGRRDKYLRYRAAPLTMDKINALLPRGLIGREDVRQDMIVALLEGKITEAQIRAGSKDMRAFVTSFRRNNFERSGEAYSLDVPMMSGRSWHETLAAEPALDCASW